MRLFESIVEVNQRRAAGARDAAVAIAELKDALPVAALTCIDARLNHLLPEMLGLPEEHFIWLRNAGNIITGPMSSTMRSLALACAVKGAREIAIIGHTDCRVGQTTAMQLLDRLTALGVDRHQLPDNLVEYFGLFGTERQNVLRGVEVARSSPLIGSKIPVHGLLLDLSTGRLEWIANGYELLTTSVAPSTNPLFAKAEQTVNAFARIGQTAAEEMSLPDAKIGEIVSIARDWLHKAESVAEIVQPAATPPTPAPAPPQLPGNPLTTLQQRMRQLRKDASNPGPGKR